MWMLFKGLFLYLEWTLSSVLLALIVYAYERIDNWDQFLEFEFEFRIFGKQIKIKLFSVSKKKHFDVRNQSPE